MSYNPIHILNNIVFLFYFFRKNGTIVCVISGRGGSGGSLFSWCQRTSTCPDKMALYNFKKIMVVPTAKVSVNLQLLLIL